MIFKIIKNFQLKRISFIQTLIPRHCKAVKTFNARSLVVQTCATKTCQLNTRATKKNSGTGATQETVRNGATSETNASCATKKFQFRTGATGNKSPLTARLNKIPKSFFLSRAISIFFQSRSLSHFLGRTASLFSNEVANIFLKSHRQTGF